jgi:AraC family transcriptional regulator
MPQLPASRKSYFEPGATLQCHRHRRGYAALVIEGQYEEASVDGRISCSKGSVILHPPWHMHSDHMGQSGALVVDIILPTEFAWQTGYRVWHCDDIEGLVSLARENPITTFRQIATSAHEISMIEPPAWLVRLVTELRTNSLPIALLAQRCGVSAEYAARMCQRWYSASPTTIRREFRTRKALQMLKSGYRPAEASVEAEFSDQSHMTRTIKAMTGTTPSQIKASLGGCGIKYVQDTSGNHTDNGVQD